MSRKYDAAFPMYIPAVNCEGMETVHGMFLRDYFAAKALQAIIPLNERTTVEDDVALAYRYADAMMEHLEVPE